MFLVDQNHKKLFGMNIVKDKGIICLYFMKYISIVSFITFCLSRFLRLFLIIFSKKIITSINETRTRSN